MEKLPITIFGSRMLVAGFGRTAKRLCLLLSCMGAYVTVAARSDADLATAASLGYSALEISRAADGDWNYDAVINTVPAKVVDSRWLEKIGRGGLVIDLASLPGGVDTEAAERLEVEVVVALSLPGKVAPKTAGEIIKNTVIKMLEKGLSQ